MKIIASLPEMRAAAESLRAAGKRIGVVPTMGFLHEGHLSLIRAAKKKSDVVITTIFVNPTQFAPNEDFSRYPRNLERDTMLAESAGADILFCPETAHMYPEPYDTFVETGRISAILEGKSRPTHFRGVTTIVTKLFHLTKPNVALFGQKDAQQAFIIKKMVKDLNFDVNVVVAPIVREPDGLAMSSRNVYLSPEERAQSLALSASLRHAESMIRGGERRVSSITGAMRDIIGSRPLAQIDYIDINDASTLDAVETIAARTSVLISLAVRFGKTRLIDNTVVDIP